MQNGKNIISIQAFNLSLSSSDFLIDAELVGIINDNEPPILTSLSPQPGRMQKLNSVTLQFSEPVRNINLRDLRLNGKLPKSFEGKNYSWTFNFSDADFGDFVLSWGEDQEIADFGRPPNKFLQFAAVARSGTNSIRTFQKLIIKFDYFNDFIQLI